MELAKFSVCKKNYNRIEKVQSIISRLYHVFRNKWDLN